MNILKVWMYSDILISLPDANSNISKSSSITSSGNKSVSKSISKKRHIASASTALLFGTILGLFQAVTLIFAAKPLLGAMGLKPVGIFIIKSNMMLHILFHYLKLNLP